MTILLCPLFQYQKNYNHGKAHFGMPKSWFLERAEYDFEGHKFYGTKDYDGFLKYSYNDYMTPLPVEKRQPHAPVSSVLAYWYLVKYFWLLLPFYGTIKETAVISYGKTKKVQNQTYG